MSIEERLDLPRPAALSAAGLAILFGTLAAFGNVFAVALVLAGVSGLVLMAQPRMLLWLVLIGGLVLSGPAELYFPGFGQIRWGVVLAALLLGLTALIGVLGSDRPAPRPLEFRNPLVWLGLFLLVALFSAAINQGLSRDAIIGLKGYFQVSGVLLALAWVGMNAATANRYIQFLLWLALLQIPFALHQFLVLVPERLSQAAEDAQIVAADVVVGTFVGNVEGGGGNAILALLQITAIGTAIALSRAGHLSALLAAVFSSACFLPLLLNETKISLVLFFVMFGVIFRDQVLRQPLRVMTGLMATAVLAVALLYTYTLLPVARGQRLADLRDVYENLLDYNIGERGYGTYVLNRTTVYRFWWQRHGQDNLVETLVGHGPGATNDGPSLMLHPLAKKVYPGMGIGLTAISALLWETGLLGLGAVLALHGSALVAAQRLSAQFGPRTVRWGLLKGVEGGIAMFAVSLFHNNYFVFEIGYQTLLMLMVGYVLQVARTNPL